MGVQSVSSAVGIWLLPSTGGQVACPGSRDSCFLSHWGRKRQKAQQSTEAEEPGAGFRLSPPASASPFFPFFSHSETRCLSEPAPHTLHDPQD